MFASISSLSAFMFQNHNVSEVGSTSIFGWPVGGEKPTLLEPPIFVK
jgi:hypothetical protein